MAPLSPRSIPPVSAVITGVCAVAFLLLAVFTAMQKEPGWITTACCGAALASLVATNLLRRILHDRAAKKTDEEPRA